MENLLSDIILHPEECAEAPCPYRCPEGLNEENPAPPNSCPVDTTVQPTTTGSTTLAVTTLVTTTKSEGGGTTPARSNGSTASPPVTASTRNGGDESMWWAFLLLGILSCAVLCCFAATVVCFVYKRRTSHNRLRAVRQRSLRPLVENGDAVELSTTPPSTPDTLDVTPDVTPHDQSIEVTAKVQLARVTVECGCGRVDGKVVKDLLPGTSYKVVMETASHGNFPKITSTTGNVDHTLCDLTLRELEGMMKHNPADRWVYSLRANFGHIKDEVMLSSLARTLRVQSLYDAVGNNFLEEIFTIDDRHRSRDEDSFKVFVILETLRASLFRADDVPQYLIDIAKCLLSLHPQCMPCGHVVHQLLGFRPLVMTTQV
ncbi:uncharacterized protein [Diadema antillarum]|uniref:uncharacterized protein n=1 Tax=Diadema antillarum TaxID=105358 RepID=UPI003A851455